MPAPQPEAAIDTGAAANLTPEQREALEAAAFRKLVAHLRARSDVQNIDLMNLGGFCRNCMSRWYREAAADRGMQKEFEAIIAAVIGGALLTGGYGSVVGACFGALIFGVVQIGITYTNINSDWFRVFLGVMLLIAVLFNNFVRSRVTEAR